MSGSLTFSVLVRELAETYPQESRAYHVLAARYYLGIDSKEQLTDRSCYLSPYSRPELSPAKVRQIILMR